MKTAAEYKRERVEQNWKRLAPHRAKTLKDMKERAIIIQDWELATALRTAQKRMEAYA